MLAHRWDTGTISPRVCCKTGSSHIPSWQRRAFAVLTAIWQHRDLLTGKDVIFFIDNEAAASAMIKGDSRLPIVGTMAMCVQLLLIRYNIAVWFEWVDSDSNLADGLSRDGAEDPWTLDQEWELQEFQGFPFAVSLVSLPKQFFQSLLNTDLLASAGMCTRNLVSLGSLLGASVKLHRLGMNTAFLFHLVQKQ